MHKESNRPQRVAELIRRELAGLILRELDSQLAKKVTLTGAEVSRDFSSARIYFSTLGGQAESVEIARELNHAAGFLRHELMHRVTLRKFPHLKFIFDESLERGARIDALLSRALSGDKDKS